MRKHLIANSFGTHAHQYDEAAYLQRRVAKTLADLLPALERPHILEIGCGTGLFTAHLLERYPDATFHITDIAPAMLDICRKKFDEHPHTTFDILDGETLGTHQKHYDLIVCAMNVQWFTAPLQSLEAMKGCLRDGGQVLYSTITTQSFPEWQEVLSDIGADSGLLEPPLWPIHHIQKKETICLHYGSAIDFLKSLKQIGAASPRAGHTPLDPATMRKACRLFDQKHQGKSSWEIVYGRFGR